MGGIDTDAAGRTCVGNFYAAGECACVSVHGANRLGGNSLLETIVFGRLVAEAINAAGGPAAFEPREAVLQKQLQDQQRQIEQFLSRRGIPHAGIRDRLRSCCSRRVGIFRDAGLLAEAVAEIRELRSQFRDVACRTPPGPYQSEILNVLQLECQLNLAEATAAGALARRESRGSHFRRDFPARDDGQWLKHTVARRDEDEIRLTYRDVDTSLYEPQERIY
jgi:succinate dehydrogenase / fumarate reductase flavoprotein subunit